ncbi:MAG: ADP-dependent NAD(P)H-hydrate dehydratase / NAD(P)H-hydrate epimerase [Pyrinomonadaceae bacterium]|nr:ADP-dependent NAD(P)H-hydrate dehydratase / NAD(P)H-hydrate epimerase [Pyrinomonadaceae bacterium]
MREIDRLTTSDYQTSSLLLMQAAAEACFHALAEHFAGGLAGLKTQILCGLGNNGGDGAALALALARAGAHADVVLFGTLAESQGDARTNFESVQKLSSFAASTGDHPPPLSFVECDTSAAWEKLATPRRAYDLIVDALFGTGLSRPLVGIFEQVVAHLKMLREARERSATQRPFIVAIDVPSGLNADSATPIGAVVQADLTVTFTAPKPANVLPPASHYNGKLVVANIGSPAALVAAAKPELFVTEAGDAREWLMATRYAPDSYKNTHGHVVVIAGSRGYTGAAVLCGNAAMRSGAGLVTIATPASAQATVAAGAMPEVMTTALAETDRGAVSEAAIDHVLQLPADVIAVGPGLSAEDERTRRFVYEIVKRRTTPIVIDADALNCLANYTGGGWPAELQGTKENPIILTPHPGEMRRLLGTTVPDALDDRVTVAREFAARHQIILVLKGARSLVAATGGRVFINPTGNAGLGTAGAGDTLTGIIAGFIAQARGTLGENADVLSATIAALYLGGLAGDLAAHELGMRAMVASDIREYLGAAIRSLDPIGERPPGSAASCLHTPPAD